MRLTVHDPSGARASIPFPGDTLTVGREDGNDVLLPAPSVSRRHCRFVRSHGGVVLEDLGSTGGVQVDGRRVEGRVALLPGQMIGVGPYTLVVVAEPGEFGLDPKASVQRFVRIAPRPASNDAPEATRRVSAR